MKGQLPLSGWGLSSQGVEQFGRSEAFVSGLHHHLSFLDHVHEFDPDQRVLGCLERFEPEHRPCEPFDGSMVLFYHIIPHSIGFSGGRLSSYVEGSSALDFPVVPEVRSPDQP
jgi:hypothetical protein